MTVSSSEGIFEFKEYNKALQALLSIDTHIRCTEEPLPYTIEELKKVLPDYIEE